MKMQITLTNTGKRFNREWIFRGVNFEFAAKGKYAITGSNGSGKSTLLQVIAGSLTHNEGTVTFHEGPLKENNDTFSTANFQHISLAAPYLDLIEEMTATEFMSFHQSFKPLSITINEALQVVQLEKAANKQVRYFSSGMKQRLKLAQAFFCKSPVLLLDEPTTNLDSDGVALYHTLIKNFTQEKLVIISSNDQQEYNFCEEVIAIGDYK